MAYLRYGLASYISPRNCKRPMLNRKKMSNYLVCLCWLRKDIEQVIHTFNIFSRALLLLRQINWKTHKTL